MIKRPSIAVAVAFLLSLSVAAQPDWKMQLVPVQTCWSKDVSPTNALPAYPRPRMVRPNCINLNGLWDYTITPKDASMPTSYTSKILVPYPLESALSGVKKSLQPSDNLWYHRSFFRPELKAGEKESLTHKRIVVHFTGDGKTLAVLSRQIFGVSLE